MSIKSVVEGIAQLIGAIVSGLRAFVSSAEFKKFWRKIGTWIESSVLWIIAAVVGLALAVVRFVKSDSFRDGVRRVRELGILGCQQGLRGIKWVAQWLQEIATSEAVKTGIATTSDLFDLFLPRSSQRITAVVIIFSVSIILILSWPESRQTETVTGPKEIVSGLKQTAPP